MRSVSARALSALALVACAVVPAQAQSLGVRGGLNVATYPVETPPEVVFIAVEKDPRPVVGFFIGTSDHLPVGVQAEVLYDVIGSKTTFPSEKARFTYLTMPVLAKLRLAHTDAVRAHALVGASVGWLLEARAIGESASEDNTDNIERLASHVVFGGSVSVKHLIIDARYSWGLRNMLKSRPDVIRKSRVLSITAGVRFGD